MNERESFLRSMHSLLTRYMERIETMNETQVVNALRACKAARSSQQEILSSLQSVSLSPEEVCEESDELRSQLRERSNANPFAVSDSIEEALTRRLEMLRKKGT